MLIADLKVADLTVKELKILIKETVAEAMDSLLNTETTTDDPDEGLELRPEVVTQLRDALRRRQAGERGTPATAVAKELGIEWDEL